MTRTLNSDHNRLRLIDLEKRILPLSSIFRNLSIGGKEWVKHRRLGSSRVCIPVNWEMRRTKTLGLRNSKIRSVNCKINLQTKLDWVEAQLANSTQCKCRPKTSTPSQNHHLETPIGQPSLGLRRGRMQRMCRLSSWERLKHLKATIELHFPGRELLRKSWHRLDRKGINFWSKARIWSNRFSHRMNRLSKC